MKINIILFFMTLLTFSCSNITSSNNDNIDKKIIGCWYNISQKNSSGPGQYISGIQIDKEGLLSRLSIETSSGRIKISADSIGRFNNINNNSFEYEYWQQYAGTTIYIDSEGTYKLIGDSLYILKSDKSNFYESKYKKTELNDIVTLPIESEFSILVDDKVYNNIKVGGWPSAYAYLKESKLYIISQGYIQNNIKKWFRIEINNFSNIGIYSKQDVSISYEEIIGGGIAERNTNEDSSSVKIKIESIENKQIQGILKFNISEINFTEGSFNIPLY